MAFTEPQTFAEGFGRQVCGGPDRIAVGEGPRSLSYAALDAQSTALADTICRKAGAASSRVALLLPHDTPAVVASVAACKTVHAFVPVDPAWPDARVTTMLDVIRPALVVTDAAGCARLRDRLGWHGVVIDAHKAGISAGSTSPCDAPSPTGLACLYFTSGSSGRPKGIRISHRAFLHGVRTFAEVMALTGTDRVAWLSPLSFGAARMTVFAPLLSGARVMPFDMHGRTPSELAHWLRDARVTLISTVPSLFRALAAALPEGGEALPDLRAVKLTGETAVAADVARFRAHFASSCTLWNGLGVTEAAGNVTFHAVPRDAQPEGETIPLGRAAPGYAIMLVDADDRPVPSGAEGEIVVRSHFLADGYREDGSDAGQRFAALPGGDEMPVFRTGDLGVIDSQGRLVGRGRRDAMLKVRGHRVEPAEVESVLLGIPGVRDVAVAGSGATGETTLDAYVVCAPDAVGCSPAALRSTLAETLPAYLVPSRIITVPSLPRLTTGKLDRAALANLEAAPSAGALSEAVPADAREAVLARIWSEALDGRYVGLTDDCFAIGGDSLRAARVAASIEARLGVSIPLTFLLDHPTVKALAQALRERDPRAAMPVAICLRDGGLGAFFCVPGAGSDAFALGSLARHVAWAGGFYALQHEALDGKRPHCRTVQAMAARFVAAVQGIQPVGPYRLGGSSFGGLVAFEMACQLSAAGERVDMVALLDTYAPGYKRLRGGLSPRVRALALYRAFLPIGRKEDLSLGNLGAGLRQHLRHGRIRLGLCSPGWRPRAAADRFAVAMVVGLRAARRYAGRRFGGRLTVFSVEDGLPPALYHAQADLGWSRWSAEPVNVQRVPGRHGEHLRGPAVCVLGVALGACLSATTSESVLDRAPPGRV